MRWSVLLISAYIAAALTVGLGALWSGSVFRVPPQLLLIVMVFVAIHAPALHASWAALLLGLIADTLGSPVEGAPVLLGPHAVGFVLGYWALRQLRHLLVRDSVVTIALLTLVAGFFAHLSVLALLSLRGVGLLAGEPVVGLSLWGQFAMRAMNLFTTAALALPLGWLLIQSKRLWNFRIAAPSAK